MIYDCTYQNAGEILTRYKRLDKLILQTKTELENCDNENNNYFIGKYDALTDNRASEHKSIVDNLVEAKKKIEQLDSEYYDDEIKFYKGYIDGLETLLEIDRSFFEKRNDVVMFLFSLDEDIRIKYELAFKKSKRFSDLNGNKDNKYYVSGDAEDIKAKAMQLDNDTEFVIVVAYDKNSLPNTEIMQFLSFAEDYNVFLHKVGKEENVEHIIKKTLRATVV